MATGYCCSIFTITQRTNDVIASMVLAMLCTLSYRCSANMLNVVQRVTLAVRPLQRLGLCLKDHWAYTTSQLHQYWCLSWLGGPKISIELATSDSLPPNILQRWRATDSCFALIGAHQCGVLMVVGCMPPPYASTTS